MKYLYIALASILIAGIFTSCEKDKEVDPYYESMNGTYTSVTLNNSFVLALIFKGDTLSDKSVTLYTDDGKTVKIVIKDVFPDEPETIFEDIALTREVDEDTKSTTYKFSGEYNNKYKYTGDICAGTICSFLCIDIE